MYFIYQLSSLQCNSHKVFKGSTKAISEILVKDLNIYFRAERINSNY